MIIIDLDNCIADDRRRIPLIDFSKHGDERYAAYHADLMNDPCVNRHLFENVSDSITIFTARPMSVHKETIAWLVNNDVKFERLFMRPDGDHSSSIELKERMLGKIDVTRVRIAYDDRPEVVDMYKKHGIDAEVVAVHDIPYDKQSVPSILRAGAKTYEERNAMYGDNYKHFGHVIQAMFPEGLTINSPDDWNRFGVFVQVVSKMTRYAASIERGGHKDSAHDAMVYSAMLEELTK